MKLRVSVAVFLAFGLVSLVSAFSLATVLSLNVHRGFNEYLFSQDAYRFDALIANLEKRAAELDPETVSMKDLLPSHEAMVEFHTRLQAELAKLTPEILGPRPPLDFRSRVIAFDENGRRIFGPPPPSQRAASRTMPMRDIVVDGRKIGSILIVPLRLAPLEVNQRFFVNQFRSGGVYVLMVLFLSLVPAWFVARGADRVVRGVKEATGDIVSGTYRKRAPDSPIKEVAEITDNINLLTEELQRLADLRRKWLAETSHELRTPLAAMTAEVDALVDGVRSYSPDAIVSLQEEANNLGRLVNDLHFLAVADLSAPSYNFKLLDPVELCSNVVARFKSRAENAGLALEYNVQIQNPVEVNWDKGRIEQVLSNALSNSIRYTEAPGKILVSVRETLSAIVLTVEDTPPGVAPEDLEQLFEPLFRVDATRDRATGGTGLGLSVAQSIVQMHGGSINAEASAMGGLRLTVTLPKRPDPS